MNKHVWLLFLLIIPAWAYSQTLPDSVAIGKNKKSVILRINDRMHPKNKRLIDLSLVAAKQLKYTSHGLTRVKVEYLGKKKPKPDEEVATTR